MKSQLLQNPQLGNNLFFGADLGRTH